MVVEEKDDGEGEGEGLGVCVCMWVRGGWGGWVRDVEGEERDCWVRVVRFGLDEHDGGCLRRRRRCRRQVELPVWEFFVQVIPNSRKVRAASGSARLAGYTGSPSRKRSLKSRKKKEGLC